MTYIELLACSINSDLHSRIFYDSSEFWLVLPVMALCYSRIWVF